MVLEGIGLFVEDMGAMIRFYRDVMGFAITQPEDAVNVYLKKDGVLFMLYERKNFEKMSGHVYEYLKGLNGHFEIALKVDSYEEVDRTFNRVTSQGAKPVMMPETMPWGQRTCYVADPEGNLIEIGAPGENFIT
ncbi:MAG: VOC family protein [Oscillospiraceae bacterium]|nr:VOC family protein [Oscillospiraceae bacterium]